MGELRRGLARARPTTRAELEADLRRLFPLIVPSEYFKRAFPAPHDPLPNEQLALTWVLLQPTTMLYLTADEAERFDAQGFAWKARSVENLEKAGGVATQDRRSATGQLAWVGMMHRDGWGSSRVSLASRCSVLFPEGYWIALPDRSYGMAISKTLAAGELEEVKEMVSKMFQGATTPMSGRLHEPAEFAIPRES
ncbi:MAG: hypothetical protein ACLQDQ_19530 [Myxococcaceae bacterium]